MFNQVLVGGSVVAGVAAVAYILVLAVVAIIAAVHPDPARRTDAREVLDRLIRAARARSRR